MGAVSKVVGRCLRASYLEVEKKGKATYFLFMVEQFHFVVAFYAFWDIYLNFFKQHLVKI